MSVKRTKENCDKGMIDYHKNMTNEELWRDAAFAHGAYSSVKNFYFWLDEQVQLLDSQIADESYRSIAPSLYAEKNMLYRIVDKIDTLEADCKLSYEASKRRAEEREDQNEKENTH